MAGRNDIAPGGSFRQEEGPLHGVRPCPLCNELMEFDPESNPQVVVCNGCGLACTIEAPAIRPTLELDEFAAAPAAVGDEDAVVEWLTRPPGPILPSPDFAARQASARRRQLALAGGVAGSAALAIALMSGYLGYQRASDRLAIETQTVVSQQQLAAQQFSQTKQRLEQQRLEAEAKRIAAQRDVRAVTAKYLAAQSQKLAASEPWQAVAVSVEAVRSTLGVDGVIVAEAHQSLRDSLYRCSGSHNVDSIELRGHAGPIGSIAVSPDGRWLVTGSTDRTARVWDLQADQPQRQSTLLDVHQKAVSSLLFTSNGDWLVTGSRDATACLWSIGANGPAAIPVVLPGRAQPISSMAMSPNCQWLAAVSTEMGASQGMGQLWNLSAGPAGVASMALTGHAGRIQAMAVSPDSRWLALGVDGVVRLWDLTARDPAAASLERQCRHGHVTATLFTSDGKWLVTCGAGREPAVRLWNLASGDPSESLLLTGLNGPVHAAAVSADSRFLVAAGDDRKLRVWPLKNIAADTAPQILAAGSADVTAVVVSKQEDWLAAADAAGSIYLWRIGAEGVEPTPVVLRASHERINALAFTPDGRWLAAAGDDWTARLWNLDVADLATKADAMAQVQIEAAERLANQSMLQQALAAVEPKVLAETTTAGLIWSAVERHAPRVQAGWRAWLRGELDAPGEPQIARGPRNNELGDAGSAAGDEPVDSDITPTMTEKPSLMVAMPEAEPAKPQPAIQHEWPVRSIVKRGGAETEPRTAARPASTLEIHTR
jgi:WD40 repeat protein